MDGFICARITSGSCCAMLDPERAESSQVNSFAIQQRRFYNTDKTVDYRLGLQLGKTSAFSDVVYDICLGHGEYL